MKIFLDTANVTELREGVAMGLVDGCTTNPSLIAKEKRSVRPLFEEICAIVPGDVSLEVVAQDFEGMMKEGKELARVAQALLSAKAGAVFAGDADEASVDDIGLRKFVDDWNKSGAKI